MLLPHGLGDVLMDLEPSETEGVTLPLIGGMGLLLITLVGTGWVLPRP
jgi:hypothetical protein